MYLRLERIFTNDKYTIGHLYYIDETTKERHYICDTLEDADRGLDSTMALSVLNKMKVYGKTAIPTGEYPIVLNVKSPKYSNFAKYPIYEQWDGYLPRLKNVKAFDGILIHIGNDENDSSGCVLVGENKVKGMVISSTATFTRLMNDYLTPCKERNESVVLEIVRKY